MKKQSDLSRLMGYAGNYRRFTYVSWALSAVSALVPFVYIWKILRDVLNAAPDYAQAVNIPHYGWMAVLFAVLSYLIYIAALMCSHLSAFRVATNLRLAVSEHLAVLPLALPRLSAAVSCARSSMRAPEQPRPIWPTSCQTSTTPSLPRWGCWFCCWRSTGAGSAEPCAGGAGFPHHGDHDRQADG